MLSTHKVYRETDVAWKDGTWTERPALPRGSKRRLYCSVEPELCPVGCH